MNKLTTILALVAITTTAQAVDVRTSYDENLAQCKLLIKEGHTFMEKADSNTTNRDILEVYVKEISTYCGSLIAKK